LFARTQNKLDGYKKEEESGKELSSEQKRAMDKYEEVMQNLDLSKDFFKQFQTIANAASKEAKRDARKVLLHNFSLFDSIVTNSGCLLEHVSAASARNDKGSTSSHDPRLNGSTEGRKHS